MVTDLIDLKWAEIEGEWVIYQEELDEWIKAQGIPKCPSARTPKPE
jgi:hypothetical protein